jgi:hypothetical protein
MLEGMKKCGIGIQKKNKLAIFETRNETLGVLRQKEGCKKQDSYLQITQD